MKNPAMFWIVLGGALALARIDHARDRLVGLLEEALERARKGPMPDPAWLAGFRDRLDLEVCTVLASEPTSPRLRVELRLLLENTDGLLAP